MAYIPSSKVSKKHISDENVFIIKSNKRPYKGPYMKTSDGSYYVGHNHTNIGPELIKKPTKSPDEISKGKLFGISKGIRAFNVINPGIKEQIGGTISPSTSKPLPTKRDYIKGFFIRYFLKRFNGKFYMEINKKIYDSILKKESKYDHNLYTIGSIRWYITGPNIHKLNSENLKKLEETHRYISYLFPVLNEYLISPPTVQENLITHGGELYYEDGSEYIGQYHIHPQSGPMEGPKHIETSHAKLYYQKHLPRLTNQAYNDFIQNYDKVTCYKCVTLPNGESKIVSGKQPKFAGCIEGSYLTRTEASDHCSDDLIGGGIYVEEGDYFNPNAGRGSNEGETSGGGGGASSGGGGGY